MVRLVFFMVGMGVTFNYISVISLYATEIWKGDMVNYCGFFSAICMTGCMFSNLLSEMDKLKLAIYTFSCDEEEDHRFDF